MVQACRAPSKTVRSTAPSLATVISAVCRRFTLTLFPYTTLFRSAQSTRKTGPRRAEVARIKSAVTASYHFRVGSTHLSKPSSSIRPVIGRQRRFFRLTVTQPPEIPRHRPFLQLLHSCSGSRVNSGNGSGVSSTLENSQEHRAQLSHRHLCRLPTFYTYTLSLHDALPICSVYPKDRATAGRGCTDQIGRHRQLPFSSGLYAPVKTIQFDQAGDWAPEAILSPDRDAAARNT